MKFFTFKKTTTVYLYKKNNTKTNLNCVYGNGQSKHISLFSNFFSPNGLLCKNKLIISKVIRNINYTIYYNNLFFVENYSHIKWIVDDILHKKTNFNYLFNITGNLIKPPFVIKSVLIPKKLRKKTKQKYLVKIVYKNEDKRLKNAYKQLYYYSNKFNDSNFDVRLYKSIFFSFLDWKNSYLFKLKSMVFKKFFKF